MRLNCGKDRTLRNKRPGKLTTIDRRLATIKHEDSNPR